MLLGGIVFDGLHIEPQRRWLERPRADVAYRLGAIMGQRWRIAALSVSLMPSAALGDG